MLYPWPTCYVLKPYKQQQHTVVVGLKACPPPSPHSLSVCVRAKPFDALLAFKASSALLESELCEADRTKVVTGPQTPRVALHGLASKVGLTISSVLGARSLLHSVLTVFLSTSPFGIQSSRSFTWVFLSNVCIDRSLLILRREARKPLEAQGTLPVPLSEANLHSV